MTSLLEEGGYLLIMTQEYLRVLSIVKPKVFIFENVTGILTMNNKKLFPTILEGFKKHGYRVQYKVLNAADYGAPQIRKRVIIVGLLKTHFDIPKL